MNSILGSLRPALSLFALLTVATGVAYPALVTGVAQLVAPEAANGSLVSVGGKVVGSRLIGQPFSSPKHFWSRPSATSPMAYNGLASGGSNLGANNPALLDAVRARVDALHASDPANKAPIPVDLVTASGSGLDPEISLAAANWQVPRVARERGSSVAAVQAVVDGLARRPWLGVIGEARVNLLALNMALDGH